MKRLSLAIVLFCAPCLCARTLEVPGGGYGSIQAAIDAAADGDIVIVSPGRYYENTNFRGRSITLRSTDPNDPNTVAATIIDGSRPPDPNLGSVVTFASGEDGNSVLDGFTIRGGTGSWLLVCWRFKGLRWNRCGGGVVCYNLSSPTITNNVFIDNSAGQGGGIYVYGDPVDPNDPSNPALHIRPLIASNTFVNNSAVVDHGFAPPDNDYPSNDHGDGGAVVAFQGCDAVITGNYIYNNHADAYGGGLHLRQWSNALIKNNRIIANGSALGAGIHITYNSSPTVTDNLIQANTAGGLGGGGIYVYYHSDPLIEHNRIAGNQSSNGAGIGVYWGSEPTIRGNLIYRNINGAAVLVVDSAPIITHNTITTNLAGIHCRMGSAALIENNIVACSVHGYGVQARAEDSNIVRYNNVWGNERGNYGGGISEHTGTDGNISVPPRFVGPDSDDYHLSYDSKCINAADPNCSAGGLADFDGEPRKMGQFADIGADEARPVWSLNSGGRYDNLQQAIDDADNGEVIVVTRGTHRGPGNRDIDFNGKALTIRSAEPNDLQVAAATIIDCQGSAVEPHRGFCFQSGEGTDSVCISSSPTIKNCILTNNSADGQGGAIYCGQNSNPLITNCIITSNTSLAEGCGGGICCSDGSDALVKNCFIAGNVSTGRGGGLYVYWSSPVFTNCTVVGNRALYGGGVASLSRDFIPESVANPVLVNCILRDNRAPLGAQAALINTIRVWSWAEHTEMTVAYSDVEAGRDGIFIDTDCILHWGPGNIDADPCFADPSYWDDANTPGEPNDDFFVVRSFHLLPGSPCADLGDNGAVSDDNDADLDGEKRIFADTVDIGADELVTNRLDLNNDGIVDYLELAVMVNEWLTSGQLHADFYEDGFIDFADYAELVKQWLWTGSWRR